MKILYVAMKYDYGDSTRGYGFEHYNFYDSLTKMDNEANQVIYFPFDELIQKFGKKEMNKKLIETAKEIRPDLCFFFLFTDEFEKETIKKLSKRFLTLNWFADDHWRFDNFSKYWAPCFNWVVTTDSQAPAKYYKLGYKNVIKSQWACNHFLYRPLNLSKIYDVTFIGQPHGNRKEIIKKIKEARINIECWGRGWSKGRIFQEEMFKIFSQSKINLNLAKSSGGISFKSLAGIFLNRKQGLIRINNPRHWFDNFKSLKGRAREQIKGRNFEIPGCRGFLLTGDADDLIDYYQDEKEIVFYKNIKDLVDKIRYYLTHDEEREAITKAGYERTLKEHTYEKRFNEIFKAIGLIK